MPLWRIHYEDGSTRSDEDGPHFEAPTRGVVGIRFARPFHRDLGLIHSKDYYYWLNHEWYGVMDEQGAGFWDYLFREGVEKYLLFGRTFSDEVWDERLRALIADRLEA